MIITPELDLPDTIGKMVKCTPKGERKGRFFCTTKGCGKLLTDLLRSMPNDGNGYFFRCPGCGRRKYMDAGVATMLAISDAKRIR